MIRIMERFQLFWKQLPNVAKYKAAYSQNQSVGFTMKQFCYQLIFFTININTTQSFQMVEYQFTPIIIMLFANESLKIRIKYITSAFHLNENTDRLRNGRILKKKKKHIFVKKSHLIFHEFSFRRFSAKKMKVFFTIKFVTP